MLYARRDRIPKSCRVRLCFQPAEEGVEADGALTGGAVPMIREGVLDGVDEAAPRECEEPSSGGLISNVAVFVNLSNGKLA